jgi:hypothetical protein
MHKVSKWASLLDKTPPFPNGLTCYAAGSVFEKPPFRGREIYEICYAPAPL